MLWLPNRLVSAIVCRKAVFAVLGMLLLATNACGFRPVYATKTPAATQQTAGVKIVPINVAEKQHMGQQFTSDLEDKLNPGGSAGAHPAYRLVVSLTSSSNPIGVARDGTVSRYNVYLNSEYTLYRLSDNLKVTHGTLRHVSSYNNPTGAYFSTYVSEQDSIKRGITELAELYQQRLSPYIGAPLP